MIDTAQIQKLIEAVEQANSPERLVESVRALTAAGANEGIPTLIAVLGYNNPGAALAAVEGLVAIGDAAVVPLIEQIDEYNYGARAYSIRALAAIANPRALDVLIAAATTDFAPSVRRAAAKGLGTLHWTKLQSDQLAQAQAEANQALLHVCQDPDWSIRYAGVVGLQGLAMSADAMLPYIQKGFEEMARKEADPAVRSRILLAQKTLEKS